MGINLGISAIQAKIDIKNYSSPENFSNWLETLTKEACIKTKDANYKLVAFPEAIGLPLLVDFEFIKNGIGKVKIENLKLQQVILFMLKRKFREVIKFLPKCKYSLLTALYNVGAIRAYKTFMSAFSKLALKYNCYISSGSIYLPTIEEESAKGIYIEDYKVKNISYFFNPMGKCIGKVEKVNLTPDAEQKSGFSKGEIYNLIPHLTPFGKVGVLICYDCFHRGLVDRFDSLGVNILIQPSFNTDRWDEKWRHDPTITQAQAWVRDGIRMMVQKRENIKVGVNPMLVGKFLDIEAEGRSSIVADASIACKEEYGYSGFLAIANSANEEEIISAYIEI